MPLGIEHEYGRIQQSKFRCARTGREMQPGEPFYSVLYDRGGGLTREDISGEAWQGPPADAFSFWQARVPPRDPSRRAQVDDELLMDCFLRLGDETEPQKVNFRYIVALLLMRRKRLKFEEVQSVDGQEWLHLRCTRSRKLHRALNPHLSDEQLAAVQEEVQRVFGI